MTDLRERPAVAGRDPDGFAPPRPPPRRGWRVGAVVAAVAMVVAAVAWGRVAPSGRTSAMPPAGLARRFLDRYEQGDGRVVRTDQGGDTVSEGQAYAMLLAVVAGDAHRFDLAWQWAATNLRRPDDGLLAWHWDKGAVVDHMPASDADLDAAWALVLAAGRFHRPDYRDQGVALSRAILKGETVVRAQPVLVAGPWATSGREIINPGYDAPEAFAALAAASGTPRWNQLEATSGRAAAALVSTGGRRLPPEWAAWVSGGTVVPVDAPGGSSPPEYGVGAGRTLMWLAASCTPDDRRLAAEMGQVVQDRPEAATRQLDGRVMDAAPSPAALAAAAMGTAPTDPSKAADLLGRAADLTSGHPSYYGDAIVALADSLFHQPAVLGACPTRS